MNEDDEGLVESWRYGLHDPKDAEIARLRADRLALLTRVEALAGALRPFADHLDEVVAGWPDNHQMHAYADRNGVKVVIDLAPFKAARALLAPCATCGGRGWVDPDGGEGDSRVACPDCAAPAGGAMAALTAIYVAGFADGEDSTPDNPLGARQAAAMEACLARLAALPVDPAPLREHDRALARRVVKACVTAALGDDPAPPKGNLAAEWHSAGQRGAASRVGLLTVDDAALDALVGAAGGKP